MSKEKLAKFADMETYENVFQCPLRGRNLTNLPKSNKLSITDLKDLWDFPS